MGNRTVLALCLGLLASCGRIDFDPLGAPADAGRTVSFGETGTATFGGVTADAYVESANPTFNNGATAQIYSSGLAANLQVGLLRFDVAALPPGTHVLSGELHLHVGNNAADTGTATLYRLLEPWTEGTAKGAAGVANWNERAAATAWAAPGAGQPGSRDTISLGSFQPAATLTSYVVPLTSEGVATVYGWIAAASTNAGFAIVSDGDDWKFDSHEGPTPADRPELVLVVDP
ncbi:MAG: DNRLRE domain-containing protein [Acidobacteriota bacterium]